MFGRWLVVAAAGVAMASAACTAQVAQPGEQQQGESGGLLDGLGKKNGSSSSSGGSSSGSTSGGYSSGSIPSKPESKTCGISSENQTCNACIQGSCCQAASACANNTQCIELFKCASQCQDESCMQMCGEQYPAGIDPLNAFGSCLKQSCTGKC